MDEIIASVKYNGKEFSIYKASPTGSTFQYEGWFYVTLKHPSWCGPYLSNESKLVANCGQGWTETLQEAFLKISNYVGE
jgi:hypothetical protein